MNKKYIIVQFHGYTESGNLTEKKFEIFTFDENSFINISIIKGWLEIYFSSFRDKKDIIIDSMQGF